MKIICRIIVSLLLSILLSFLINYSPKETTMNVFYTVSSIMFSIGMSMVVTFSPSGVKNKKYLTKIRKGITRIRNKFFIEFIIITLLFIVFLIINDKYNYTAFLIWKVEFDVALFVIIQTLFSMLYIVLTFLDIQKLNDEIFDKINIEIDDYD